MPPFSSVYLYLPLIGMITLPTADIIVEKGITVIYCVNITSGDISFEYKGSTSGRIIGTASGSYWRKHRHLPAAPAAGCRYPVPWPPARPGSGRQSTPAPPG